jgi:hypothetical protein
MLGIIVVREEAVGGVCSLGGLVVEQTAGSGPFRGGCRGGHDGLVVGW